MADKKVEMCTNIHLNITVGKMASKETARYIQAHTAKDFQGRHKCSQSSVQGIDLAKCILKAGI